MRAAPIVQYWFDKVEYYFEFCVPLHTVESGVSGEVLATRTRCESCGRARRAVERRVLTWERERPRHYSAPHRGSDRMKVTFEQCYPQTGARARPHFVLSSLVCLSLSLMPVATDAPSPARHPTLHAGFRCYIPGRSYPRDVRHKPTRRTSKGKALYTYPLRLPSARLRRYQAVRCNWSSESASKGTHV